MRVLVTGSSGRLGTAVAALVSTRHEVVGLDRVPGRWTTIVGGIEDRSAVDRAIRSVDAIIHTASLHAPDVRRFPDQTFVAVNVDATRYLLQAAVGAGARRFVYTSTTSVYGDQLVPRDRAVWVTEELPPRPRDIYDVTKLAAEQLCATFAREANLTAICLRTARFFPESPRVAAVHRLSRGLDVRDAASAHLLAVENQTVNVGTYIISARSPFVEADLPGLLDDAARIIQRIYPWAEAAFTARGWRLPETIDRVYVTARAEAELGFRPAYNFDRLMREVPFVA
jgi:UDP-glucose 4-epimerase